MCSFWFLSILWRFFLTFAVVLYLVSICLELMMAENYENLPFFFKCWLVDFNESWQNSFHFWILLSSVDFYLCVWFQTKRIWIFWMMLRSSWTKKHWARSTILIVVSPTIWMRRSLLVRAVLILISLTQDAWLMLLSLSSFMFQLITRWIWLLFIHATIQYLWFSQIAWERFTLAFTLCSWIRKVGFSVIVQNARCGSLLSKKNCYQHKPTQTHNYGLWTWNFTRINLKVFDRR